MNSFSIKTKLSLAMAVVFVVLAVGEAFFAIRYFEDAYRKNVAHDLTLMGATLADSVDSRLVMAQSALEAAKAALPPMAIAKPSLAQNFLDERVTLQSIFPKALLLISPKGRLIAAHPPLPTGSGQDFSHREFFLATLFRKSQTLTAISEQPGGDAEVIVATPVLDRQGKVMAVMAGIADLTFSKSSIEVLLREKIGPGAHLYIAARNGTYLLHHGENRHGEEIPVAQRPLFRKALAGVAITEETVDCCGERVIAAFQLLTGIDSILMISSPLALAYAPLDRAEAFFLGSIILGTVALLVIAWIITARIIAPLQVMTSHVKALPELPSDKRRLHLDRGDEIGVLADAFNQMMVNLENRQVELVKANQDLQQRTVELAVMNRELEAFGSALSHDLKTPLASISLSAETLQEGLSGEGGPQAAFLLSTILAESDRMNDLVDAMLLLSQASKAEIRREQVNLSLMATEILLRLSSGNPERKAEWVVAPDAIVSGDARLLMAALENLIGNAWKYTGMKDTTRIEFGFSRNDERVYFVRDNGAGFDMAHAARLFEPFQRLHAEPQFKGFGIGLATVQRIINRHGGKIWAEAVPGEGATFFFTVPDTQS